MLKLYACIFLTTLCISLTAEENLIQSLRFPKKNRIEVTINADFKKAYLLDDFFVEYDEDIDLTKLDYSIVTLPFIMNVMSLIWISGNTYSIDSMDQGVYDSLERIKLLFKLWYPRTSWNGRLRARKIVTAPTVTTATDNSITALLFSGGVDSLACSFEHREKKQLLVTAWGQSCLPLHEPELWHSIKQRLVDFAELYGHKNAFLTSNYYYFLNLKKLSKLSPEIRTWRIQTVEDIGWAGLIAPILMSKGISTLHIGSSDSILRFYPTACNPYIDGNIRFAGLHFKHDQFDLTRHDKIRFITDLCKHHLIEKPQLIICQKPGGIINCGSCEKCCATLLSLLSLEEDPWEFGYTITPEQAISDSQALLKNKEVNSVVAWMVEDIKESGLARKNSLCNLSWLNRIDTTELKPYDLKEMYLINLTLMKKLFPDIAY